MFVLALLFLVVPFVELYLIVQVSHSIGFFNTLGVLILVSIVGAALVKRQGVRVWARFNESIAGGRVPSTEVAQGVCLLVAGALMITPGFFTDAIGILLLFPPSQAVLLRLLRRRVSGTTKIVTATYGGPIDVDGREQPGPSDPNRPPSGELGP
ncbi:MAG: FxsA family protein [Phycisphaerales bacterium]|nr:FxsA family protein [Phycisphaerales bacterium]